MRPSLLQKEPKVFALAFGSLALAACGDEVPELIYEASAQTLLEAEDTLDEHEWRVYPISVSIESGFIRIEGRHISGPPIDFVFMARAEYDRIAPKLRGYDGGQFRYFTTLSSENLSGSYDTDWRDIGKGEYVLIIDNSGNFGASPIGNFQDDTVRFMIKIRGLLS